MNNQHCVYFHINDIKKIGLERWHEDFFWPLSGDAFVEIYHAMRKAYHSLVAASQSPLSDLLTAEFKLVYVLSEALCALRLQQACKLQGCKIVYSGGIAFFDLILSGLKGNKDMAVIRTFDQKIWDRPVDKLRLRYLILRHLLNRGSICSLLTGSYMINIGKMTELKRKFLTRANKTSVDFSYLFSKAVADCKKDTELCFDAGKASYDIMCMTSEVGHSLDIDLPEQFFTTWKVFIEGRLKRSAVIHESLINFIRNRKWLTGRSYLLNGLGNQYHRLIALAARKSGVKVVAATHGNTMGMVAQSRLSDIELSLVDSYLVQTQFAKKNYERILQLYPPVGGNRPEIISMEHDQYYKLCQKEQKSRLPSKIRKVMFIEHPTIYGHDHDIPFGFQPILLDLAVRVLKCLSGHFHVMVSVHPDALQNSDQGQIYRQYVDEIICDRFENNYDAADAFVFGYFPGTCFGFSLPTNKRIVYFDYGFRFLDKSTETMIKKRCYCLKTRTDERNRLLFDDSELLRVLTLPPEEPDMEFVKKKMFPVSEAKEV